jgi:chorismate mutase
MVQANGIEIADLGAGFITSGGDVSAGQVIQVVRYISPEFEYLPLTAAVESSSAPELIRVLLLWNTARGPREIKHVYLRGTEAQRWAGVAEVAG